MRLPPESGKEFLTARIPSELTVPRSAVGLCLNNARDARIAQDAQARFREELRTVRFTEVFEEPHNLKVVGSNPTPATTF